MDKELEFKEDKMAVADAIGSRRSAYIEGAVAELRPLTEGMIQSLLADNGTVSGEDLEELKGEIMKEFEEYLGSGMGRAFKRFKREHLGK